MSQLLGPKRVFMDVEDIAPGQNFADAIDHTISSCSAMLVVIGPRWFQILQERVKQGGEDYVRHEIESGLTRKITVIPVFVGGATLAQFTSVPPALSELPFHQAMELRDSSFKDDCDRLARAVGIKPARNRSLALIAVALILVALLVGSRYAFKSWRAQKQQQDAITQILSTVQTQTKLGEYQSAFQTASRAVKAVPNDPAVLDQQVDSAMLWLEHYNVLVAEGQKAETVAAPELAELMLVLDGGLARAGHTGSRSADILAHIGWAHWLNSHIAEKEFGPAAENAFRQALAIEPVNVYANAMLGNWLLQNNGSLAQAIQYFSTALSAGRERPLVRTMQLGGMLYNEADGVRAEALKVLNDMREAQEPLAPEYRGRFISYIFDLYENPAMLKATLSAVSQDQAWQTYLWLDNPPTRDPEDTARLHKEVHARIYPPEKNNRP